MVYGGKVESLCGGCFYRREMENTIKTNMKNVEKEKVYSNLITF
jgi:hypothetical protein